jgi:hypothetical protein
VEADAIAAHLAAGYARTTELLQTAAIYGMVHCATLIAVAGPGA